MLGRQKEHLVEGWEDAVVMARVVSAPQTSYFQDYVLTMTGGWRCRFLATKIKMKEEIVDCFEKRNLKGHPLGIDINS